MSSSNNIFLTSFWEGRNLGASLCLPQNRFICLEQCSITPGQCCSQDPPAGAGVTCFVLPWVNVLFWLHSSFLQILRALLHGQDVIRKLQCWEEKCIYSSQSRSWWGLLYPRGIWTGEAPVEGMPTVHSRQWSLAQPLHRRRVSVHSTPCAGEKCAWHISSTQGMTSSKHSSPTEQSVWNHWQMSESHRAVRAWCGPDCSCCFRKVQSKSSQVCC